MANLGDRFFVEVNSYIRGIHAYDRNWKPHVGEILPLQREPDNPKDSFAVAVHKQADIKGHVPRRLSHLFSTFLQRDFSEGEAEVTGERLNRGAGYGVEVPCTYRLFGKKLYLDRLQKLCDNMKLH